MVRGAVMTGAVALLVAGCGGGERQDADEPSGTFPMEVVDARFDETQRLADQRRLQIRVRNTGSRAVPNAAVSVDGLTFRSEQPGLSDPERPVWIVDDGPAGGTTAYVNTWALGRLEPGATRTFTWKLTAIKPGTHTVRYRVSAGLDGKARAVAPAGDRLDGSFTVRVSDRPAPSRVDPETGRVVPAS
jgi:hypothetical protein